MIRLCAETSVVRWLQVLKTDLASLSWLPIQWHRVASLCLCVYVIFSKELLHLLLDLLPFADLCGVCAPTCAIKLLFGLSFLPRNSLDHFPLPCFGCASSQKKHFKWFWRRTALSHTFSEPYLIIFRRRQKMELWLFLSKTDDDMYLHKCQRKKQHSHHHYD